MNDPDSFDRGFRAGFDAGFRAGVLSSMHRMNPKPIRPPLNVPPPSQEPARLYLDIPIPPKDRRN